MMVPTRVRKICVRSHKPSSRLRRCGQWYSGSSISSGWYSPRIIVRFSTKRHQHRAGDAGDVEREQHQAPAG